MTDRRFAGLWCDGFIPAWFYRDETPPFISGLVWICKDDDQQEWQFRLLLPEGTRSREQIDWSELLPAENVTEWLALDWKKKYIEIEPSAAIPDSE